ncbi:hypothetical protein [Sandaracinus amylolyticus]|uniref:hypothetical protein n=1 Tax=Sandaracinus amylolyticus TaxID=927083 RepID=UPI0012EE398B|nr:hypothetical protein [Sandaracinus amylolyticus]
MDDALDPDLGSAVCDGDGLERTSERMRLARRGNSHRGAIDEELLVHRSKLSALAGALGADEIVGLRRPPELHRKSLVLPRGEHGRELRVHGRGARRARLCTLPLERQILVLVSDANHTERLCRGVVVAPAQSSRLTETRPGEELERVKHATVLRDANVEEERRDLLMREHALCRDDLVA